MARSSGLTGRRALFGLGVVLILFLALMPASTTPDWFPQADKLRHASAFAVLWVLGLRSRLMRPGRLALALLALGVAIEVAQSFTPDREPSGWDVLADAAGIALGWRLWPADTQAGSASA